MQDAKSRHVEKRSEQTPVIALRNNRVRLERPNPMQNFWIVPVPGRNLEQENKHVDQHQYEHRRRASKLTPPSGRSDVVIGGNGTERTWMWSVRFQMAKQPDLLAQFGGRMENLESCTKSSSRFII